MPPFRQLRRLRRHPRHDPAENRPVFRVAHWLQAAVSYGPRRRRL